ncbi:MAG: DUF1266 domain-containing protein [Bacteroidota bacterium]
MFEAASLPWWLTGAALLLLFLAWRGIVNKSVRGTYQTQTSAEAGYYLRITAYLLGGLLLLVIAAMQWHAQGGWRYSLAFSAATALLIALVVRFKPLALGFLRILLAPFQLIPWKKAVPNLKKKTTEAAAKPSARQWVLAAVAMISRAKGMQTHLIGGEKPSPRAASQAQKRLNKEWDIKHAEDFLDTQEWLLDTGHRKDFYQFVETVEKWEPEELEAFVLRVERGEEELPEEDEAEEVLHRLKMIQEKGSELRFQGFLAWDMLRYLDNCRLGFLAGYLDENSAEQKMLAASRILQSRFGSWSEMGENFLQGREFWSIIEHRQDGVLYRNAMRRLADDPQSEWQRVPWDLALYVGSGTVEE